MNDIGNWAWASFNHYQWMESQPLKKKDKENGKLTLGEFNNQIHQIFIDSWETGNGHEFQYETNNHPQYESYPSSIHKHFFFFLLTLMFLRILIQLTCRYSTLLCTNLVFGTGDGYSCG